MSIIITNVKNKIYFILLQNEAQYVLEEELEISNSSIGTGIFCSFDYFW